MNLYPQHIRINGLDFKVEEFIGKEHSAHHENDLAGFLKEWYGPADSIVAETSGSTGTPKTIRLNKEFVVNSALRTIGFFNLRTNDSILLCLPLKFIAGKLMVVRALAGNLNLITTDPATGFSFLQTEKFRFAAMVPHQVQKILDAEPHQGAWLQNIGTLLIGGSALPHSLEDRLQNVTTSCWASYGMTETATHIALRQINGDGADDWYRCLKDISVQLSAEGCLEIHMPGLAEHPLITTDLAEVKDKKTFKISGRADNAIISGGIKYSPEQLEKKLEPYIHHPFAITSLPHESLGQQLVLVAEAAEDEALITQLLQICKKHLDRYEQPRQILFVSEIPKTENGKTARHDLLARLNA